MGVHAIRRAGPAAVMVMGAVLVAGCSGSEDSSASGGGGAAAVAKQSDITLPRQLGKLLPTADQCRARGGDVEKCMTSAKSTDETMKAAAENLSHAYAGASAVGAQYTAEDFSRIVDVLAVGASSPGLWTTDSDVQAARMQIGHPQEWVEVDGDAQCLARTKTLILAGQSAGPDDTFASKCEATRNGLTVFVFPGADASLQEALDWTNQAFQAIATG